MVQHLLTLSSSKVGLLIMVFIYLVFLTIVKLGFSSRGKFIAKVGFMTSLSSRKLKKNILLKITTNF